MKDLKYYKDNCEEDYLHTPISVLRYITELEKEVESKPLIIDSVVFNEADKDAHTITLELNKPVRSKLSDWTDKSEVELCDKNENRFGMCNCCGDDNCHDSFCKG